MKVRSFTRWTTRDGKVRRIRLFEAWRNMLGRCKGGKSTDAGKYWNAGYEFGGWEHFRAWAIHAGYRKGVQLDRIRGHLPYSPTNCQWLTPKAHGKKSYATAHRPGCPCNICGKRVKHTKRSSSVAWEPPTVPTAPSADGVPF